MLTMNEKDKNEMLEAILNENEAYQCKLWAVIMAGADTYALIGGLSTLTGGAAAALGALSNAYCYLGVTEQHLNMVIVNSVNVSKIENRLSLLHMPPQKCSLTADDGASPPPEWCTASAEMVHGGR